MTFLPYIGDALWIVALAIMFSASANAWKRIDADTLVPMQFRTDGTPSMRQKKVVALWLLPVTGFLIGAILLINSRRTTGAGDQGVIILFGVRATLGALFAIAHLRWLKAALEVLQQEGRLK